MKAPALLRLSILVGLLAASRIRAEEAGTGHHLPGSGVFLIGLLQENPGRAFQNGGWEPTPLPV